MKNLRKKLALLLAFVMILSLVPAAQLSLFGQQAAGGVVFRVTSNDAEPVAASIPGNTVMNPGPLNPFYRGTVVNPGNLGFIADRAYNVGSPLTAFEFEIDPAWFANIAPIAPSGMTNITLGGAPVSVPEFQLELVMYNRYYAGTWRGANFYQDPFVVFPGGAATAGASTTVGSIAIDYRAARYITIGGVSDIPDAPILVRGFANVHNAQANIAIYLRSVVRSAAGDYVPVRVALLSNQPLVREWAGLGDPERYQGLVVSLAPNNNPFNLTRFAPVVAPVPRIRFSEYRVGTLRAGSYALSGYNIGDRIEITLLAPVGYTWAVEDDVFEILPGGSFIPGALEVRERVAPTTAPGTTPRPVQYEDMRFRLTTTPTESRIAFVVPVGFGFNEDGVGIPGLRRAGGVAAINPGFFDVSGLTLVPRNAAAIHAHGLEFNVAVETRNLGTVSADRHLAMPWVYPQLDGANRINRLARTNIRTGNLQHVATFWQQAIELRGGTPVQLTAGRLEQVTATVVVSELAPESFIPQNTLPVSIRVDHPGVTLRRVYVRSYNVGYAGYYNVGWGTSTVAPDGIAAMMITNPHANPNYMRALEFRLVLDVAPGFTVNNWNPNIVAEFGVFGVNELLPNNRTATVATVRDPISLQAGALSELRVHGDPFGVIHPERIPSVRITEAYQGALIMGEFLYIYLVPTIGTIVFNDPFGHLGLNTVPVPRIIGDAAFTLSEGVVLLPGHEENGTDFIKIRYRVDIESYANPATIIFDDGILEGVITTIEGLTVSFAVGGPAVVEGWSGDDAVAVPYRIAVARFGDDVVIGVPTPSPTPGQTPTPTPPAGPAAPSQVSVPAGMATTVGMPSGYNVGKLPAIILPGIIPGVTVTPSLGGERVTISGHRVNGNPVTIVLTAFDSFAVVNNNEQDIALSSFTPRTGLSSGPSGSVWPTLEGGQLLLPLRFIARMFGYTNIGFDGTNFVLSE